MGRDKDVVRHESCLRPRRPHPGLVARINDQAGTRRSGRRLHEGRGNHGHRDEEATDSGRIEDRDPIGAADTVVDPNVVESIACPKTGNQRPHTKPEHIIRAPRDGDPSFTSRLDNRPVADAAGRNAAAVQREPRRESDPIDQHVRPRASRDAGQSRQIARERVPGTGHPGRLGVGVAVQEHQGRVARRRLASAIGIRRDWARYGPAR